MTTITRKPLCWPENIARRAPHQRGHPHFNERSLAEASHHVRSEINRLNGRRWDYEDESVIISSNLKYKQDGTPFSQQVEPIDSGVAVYFTLRIWKNGKWLERPIVMTCDKWLKTSDNLFAIGKDIEAQRARERWGCMNYEQAFRGYLAIPERCNGEAWWTILQVPSSAGRDAIESGYKARAKALHPDAGGTDEAFAKLTVAFEQAMSQCK